MAPILQPAQPVIIFPGPTSRWRDLMALAAGAIYPLGFAPLGWRAAVLLSLIVFWWSLGQLSPRRALWRGYAFGLGLFGVGVAWVYESLHYFGEAIAAVALLGTVGFVAVAALYTALFAWLWVRFFAGRLSPIGTAVALPVLWVVIEWFRGWFLGGFPWLVSGYASLDTPIAPFATLGGVYFNSLLVALIASSLRLLFMQVRTASVAFVLVLFAFIGGGGGALRAVDFTQIHGEPLRVRMVQGNIEQGIKFDPDNLVPSLERYMALSEQGETDYDLLIWPETAVPAFYEQVEPVIGDYRDALKLRGVDWLIGGFSFEWDSRQVFNAVRLITDDEPAEYRKHHLVPFGEYLPFRGVLDVLSAIIAVPMSDISAGVANPQPIDLGGVKVAMSICYEDAFGEEVIRQLPDAHLLVNVSNDAWFGDSWAPAQHQEIARMRTIETGRPQLRATNTGISALMDHHGDVVQSGPSFVEAVLDVTVQPRRGTTPYVRWGNPPVVIVLLVTLAVFTALSRRRQLPYTRG